MSILQLFKNNLSLDVYHKVIATYKHRILAEEKDMRLKVIYATINE